MLGDKRADCCWKGTSEGGPGESAPAGWPGSTPAGWGPPVVLERTLGTEVARGPPGTVCPTSSETPALLCWGSLRGVERGSLGLEEDAAAAGGREWVTNQLPLGPAASLLEGF